MNLGSAIRTALLGEEPISGSLSLWNGFPSIHTRRPLPEDVVYPLIAISPDISNVDNDALNSRRDQVIRDVITYGQQPDHFRLVEQLGYLVKELFHRQRHSIALSGYHVIQIRASGPIPAPTDDKNLVARMVTLHIDIQLTS